MFSLVLYCYIVANFTDHLFQQNHINDLTGHHMASEGYANLVSQAKLLQYPSSLLIRFSDIAFFVGFLSPTHILVLTGIAVIQE